MRDDAPLVRLVAELDRHETLAIAVSGGIDSMLLAYIAHRHARTDATAVHAPSAAVPAAATARVEAYAKREGWRMRSVDAGELADGRYRANPVDRCYFCKTNLYSRIRAVTALPIASGTNEDDLGDYRPGLAAAREHDVVHPYVEAGIGKAEIYRIARALGLDDLSALPAQPCLASRIETGIGVDVEALGFIHAVELALAAVLPQGASLRCRITASGVWVECDPLPEDAALARIATQAGAITAEHGRVFAGVRRYRRGSAFLHTAAA